jgi:hypothetical protein
MFNIIMCYSQLSTGVNFNAYNWHLFCIRYYVNDATFLPPIGVAL